MLPFKPECPYFENWLRRARRQLAPSGRISEMAVHLAKEEGNSPEYWAGFMRSVLEERVFPPFDLLIRIDLLLAKPAKKQALLLDQPLLF